MNEDRGPSGERRRGSSRRKTEIVLWVLRGEDLDALSRPTTAPDDPGATGMARASHQEAASERASTPAA